MNLDIQNKITAEKWFVDFGFLSARRVYDYNSMAEPDACAGQPDGDENQNTDDAKFYGKAKEYWEAIPPSLDGMLGGFAKISPTDIDGSRAFLRPFLKVCMNQILSLDNARKHSAPKPW